MVFEIQMGQHQRTTRSSGLLGKFFIPKDGKDGIHSRELSQYGQNVSEIAKSSYILRSPVHSVVFVKKSLNGLDHGLRAPSEGINQRNLKIWADVADKICFGHT